MTPADEGPRAAEGEVSLTAAEQVLHDALTSARALDEETLVVAVEHGAAALPAPPELLPPGRAVIAAAGVCGPHACVLVLFRDVDGHLCSDTHLLQRTTGPGSAAAWSVLPVQVSTCLPEDVLAPRPDRPPTTWCGDELTSYLTDPVTAGQGRWFAAVTLRATTRVQVVEVEVDTGAAGGVQRHRVAVSPGGLVSAPLPMRHGLDAAVCRGLDAGGRVVDVRHYQVLSEMDRGWPSPSSWQEPPGTH